jgi:hypothetical protein
MAPDELAWLEEEFTRVELAFDADGEACRDNHRAARVWKSSQMRRFVKQRNTGCCGSHEWVARRWSWPKLRWDLYLLGFNYGH